MKNYFILNPIAGQGLKKEGFLEQYKILKQKYPNDIELYETKSKTDATIIAKKIVSESHGEAICVFACGGDGTMNEVLNGLVGAKNVTLGVVPVGSCNDFLKSFEQKNFMNLEDQLFGQDIDIDILKVDDFYCANVANIGFDAKVNYDQIQLRRNNLAPSKAYNKAIVKNLMQPLGDRMKITIDGKPFFDGKALLVAIANGQWYGGGFHCAPKASASDGVFDIFIVNKVGVLTFASLVKKFKAGQLYGDESRPKIYASSRGTHVDVVSDIDLTICLDGETFFRKECHIDTLHNFIKFRIPRQ